MAMTSETFSPAKELKRIIAEGHLSEDALHAITGIQPEKLRAFLDGAQTGMSGSTAGPQAFSGDEITRLSILAAHLTEGLRIGDDDRLKAIFESLVVECRLTLSNIAQLTGLDVDDLASALRDPRSVAIEKRYELAIRGSYLINALSQARAR